MARLTRPNGDKLSRISPIVDMLVTNHWRDTNEVTCLPGMSRALVKVKTLAFHHQQKLLEDMTVFATTLAGRDLLCHQIQAWSRHFCIG